MLVAWSHSKAKQTKWTVPLWTYRNYMRRNLLYLISKQFSSKNQHTWLTLKLKLKWCNNKKKKKTEEVMVELPRLVFYGTEEKCRTWLMAERNACLQTTTRPLYSQQQNRGSPLVSLVGDLESSGISFGCCQNNGTSWENMLRMRPNTHVVSISEFKIQKSWKTGHHGRFIGDWQNFLNRLKIEEMGSSKSKKVELMRGLM